MEKDEKTIVDPVVDDTIETNDSVIENPENDNMEQVDDNTEIEPENTVVTPAEEPVIPPVVDDTVSPEPIDTVVPPADDVTLAPTDDVIPAPDDTFPLGPVEPVSPEIPVEPAPVSSDVVPEMGDESPADGCCGDGCCAEEPCCPQESAMTIGNFFGTLQECVTIIWRFHLKTRKHHIHVALNEFYEKALDIVDSIIEQYQGICGVVEEPFINCIVGDGKTEGEYLTELKAFVENNKSILGCHSEIDSTIDEFLALIDSTNYKLTAFVENVVKSFDEFVYEDYPAIKESCRYDRYGERSSDDPDDPDYDPNFDGESGEEEE